MRTLGWLFALMAFGFLPPSLPAQVPDSLPRDSVPQDTVDLTARFLEAQELEAERAAVFPLIGTEGVRTPGNRIVFTRDSLEWADAQTLGDILAQVPGVFLWRGGWIGRPELPNYRARGGTSVEYFLDGLPLTAIGQDSVTVDPVLMALSLLERIEVERWPGMLRVRLFTRRHDRIAARSRIGVGTGDDDVARYDGALQRRFRSGMGFSLGADFLSAPTASGFASDHEHTQYWIQVGYLKSRAFGAQAQLLRTEPKRDAFLGSGSTDSIGAPLEGNRNDYQVRLFTERGPEDRPLRVDLLYGRTSWSGSGVEQTINRYGVAVGYRAPTLSLRGSVFGASRWTALDLGTEAGWSPLDGLVFHVEGHHGRHDEDRSSTWVGLGAGLELPFGLVLSGTARLGSVVHAPAIDADSAQDLRDVRVAAGWQDRRLGVEVAVSRTAAFQPRSFQPFLTVPSLGSSPDTDWLTLALRVSPASWLTLSGWYSDVLNGSSLDGQPPEHMVGRATIRSGFLRKFPSGIFDLKLELSVERWGAGVLGRDVTGAPIAHPGATFLRGLAQLEFGRLRIFYDRYNLQGINGAYVPGFTMPTFNTTFGVRWDFLN
ncbi:MAG: TonB-dependent receptor plug domain-containing protein [Gemmatimonadales bacterium]|nr:TonB-dependent receptor plug domain-containing protein [Gemmatimonadales bacterium]